MKLYREWKFQESLSIFKIIKNNPSEIFCQRCKEFIKNNPWDKWGGVYKFKIK